MRVCWNCKTARPESEFRTWTNPRGTVYTNKQCRSCEKVRDKKYRERPERKRLRKFQLLLWNYGLTEKEWAELLCKQGGKCPICEKSAPDHVDHDHKTGKIRGLLCGQCNVALGMLKDSPRAALRAAKYLKGT